MPKVLETSKTVLHPITRNENQPNGEYFEGYGDFGTESDPLYAKAISLISGSKVTTPTRAVNQAKEQMLVIATPRLNRIGMIK